MYLISDGTEAEAEQQSGGGCSAELRQYFRRKPSGLSRRFPVFALLNTTLRHLSKLECVELCAGHTDMQNTASKNGHMLF